MYNNLPGVRKRKAWEISKNDRELVTSQAGNSSPLSNPSERWKIRGVDEPLNPSIYRKLLAIAEVMLLPIMRTFTS